MGRTEDLETGTDTDIVRRRLHDLDTLVDVFSKIGESLGLGIDQVLVSLGHYVAGGDQSKREEG